MKVERIGFFYIPPISMRLRKLIVNQKRWCIFCEDWVNLFHFCKEKSKRRKKAE